MYLHDLGLWRVLWRTVKNSQNLVIRCRWGRWGLYRSLMNFQIFLLGAMWGSLYLVQIRGLMRADASFVTSMLFIGTIIGAPVVGWLSDRIKRRRIPMMVGAVIALFLILLLMYLPHLSLLALLVLINYFLGTRIYYQYTDY
ncbi:MFS transporter [Candidatus Coxiella mudrowiae]|uniref:MFS transporter n=1 Tax=Candidatus Coxiella mudrowiae TaxID=2054173 RepID=UPI002467F2D5|nr:MFS transporter [Candidatus Coxiella mudrowiae]